MWLSFHYLLSIRKRFFYTLEGVGRGESHCRLFSGFSMSGLRWSPIPAPSRALQILNHSPARNHCGITESSGASLMITKHRNRFPGAFFPEILPFKGPLYGFPVIVPFASLADTNFVVTPHKRRGGCGWINSLKRNLQFSTWGLLRRGGTRSSWSGSSRG